jgi:hypothetical protein
MLCSQQTHLVLQYDASMNHIAVFYNMLSMIVNKDNSQMAHLLFSTIPISWIVDILRHSLPDESVLMFLLESHHHLSSSVVKHGALQVVCVSFLQPLINPSIN